MKLAIAQFNSHIGNFQKNYERIIEISKDALKKGADMVVFPELALCGYPPQDLLNRKAFWDENRKMLELLKENLPGDIAVIVGALRDPGFNTAFFFYKGEMEYQDKTLLPTYDVFDEFRYFSPSTDWKVFNVFGKKILLTVCEDIWDGYEEEEYPHNKIQDFDLIINIAASPFEMHKLPSRFRHVERVCRQKNATGVYVNMIGGNDELIFDGRSFILHPDGTPAFLGSAFEEELTVLDLEKLKKEEVKFEEHDLRYLHDALVLGVRDYFKKTGFQKAVLGLSGGIDSALVICLAVEALGKENVTALLMPGPFSSEHSVVDATRLAQNLGVTYHVISIERPYEEVNRAMEHVFKGLEFDVTEENIQSRLRGMLQMAYSNKFRALNLNTGNKSELAVGYCTLYGDMTGALAVLGDVYKSEVFQLAKYINREKEIIPENIITKPPSAELRPNQKDQDSLPPYEILDTILLEYLEKSKTAEQIVEEYDMDPATVNGVIHKVYVSEYKRRQAPIVLKVSSKAFGSGRRIPVSTLFK
jgi:NAD+ synthase (glutamine-hydrolysing)